MAIIQTPTNQIRFSNVCYVRLRRGGHRFELACYPNKVVSWRDGVETDLDEVLQVPHVFTNVTKGEIAKRELLVECFGSADESAAVRFILEKGELQVTERERQVALEKLRLDIAGIIASKCVDSDSGRPFTPARIEQALRDIHFNVRTTQSAKKQALDAIRALEGHLHIRRAAMRIKVVVPNEVRARCRASLKPIVMEPAVLEAISDDKTCFTGIYLIDPAAYRVVDENLLRDSKGRGLLEVLELAVAVDESRDIE